MKKSFGYLSKSQRIGLVGFLGFSILYVGASSFFLSKINTIPNWHPPTGELKKDSTVILSPKYFEIIGVEAQWGEMGFNPSEEKRIKKFGNSIKGYAHLAQLKKVYGIKAEKWDSLGPYLTFRKDEWQPSPFNPNIANREALSKNRLPEKYIEHLIAFRQKGGAFKEPIDMYRVYGAHTDFIYPLLNYVRIPEVKKEVTPKFKGKLSIFSHEVDSLTLVNRFKVSKYTAGRFIQYRNKLGGFYSKNQFSEVYGLKRREDSVLRFHLSVDSNEVVKLNINKLGNSELASHPYLNWENAEKIVGFRTHFRTYKSAEELVQLSLMTPEKFSKIAPYISTD